MRENPTTLSEILEDQAADLGDIPFLAFEGRTLSFADLNREVNRVATGLASLGVGEGTGVVIMMSNSPEWLFVYFASQKLGAYAVPVNIALRGEGLRYVLDHSDSAALVCDVDLVDTVLAVVDGAPKIDLKVVNSEGGTDTTAPAGWHKLSSVAARGTDHAPEVKIDLDAMSMILYTSGTTGVPKGVVSRYRGLNIGGIRLLAGMLQPDEVLYTCLPLFHANALLLTVMRAMIIGRPVVLSRRFSASRFWDEIRGGGATTFNTLGAMIPIMMKQPERPDDAENPVRVVFSAACPASLWVAFEQRFGVQIIEAYAAVDGGGFVIMNFGQSPKGSIGTPMSPIRIVDDDGADVAVGTPGELWFQVDDPEAHKVEYYKDPTSSNAKVQEGWLHTGDLVSADEDGNLYFVDRKSDSLRRRGENISSWEVEREINAHPVVLESAVFGVPSELGEDDVMVVLVTKPGQSISPEEVVAHCQERMAAFMVPRYVEVRDAIPKTETHRVQKTELKRVGVGPDTWDREASRPAK